VALVALAREHDAPLFAVSSLRHALGVQEIRDRAEEFGAVVGAVSWSSASLRPRNPGLYHYGIHGLEALCGLMGPGCRSVTCTSADDDEVCVGRWRDGRIGVLQRMRSGPRGYGFTAWCEKAIETREIGVDSLYRELLRRVVAFFGTGIAPVSAAETLEVMAFIEAAMASARSGAAPQDLPRP
jgi:hypothetical protein